MICPKCGSSDIEIDEDEGIMCFGCESKLDLKIQEVIKE